MIVNGVNNDNSAHRTLRNHQQEERSLHSVSFASTVNSTGNDSLNADSLSRTSFSQRSPSPVVPALPMYLRPESRILPSNYQVPPEVYTNDKLHKGFCRLSGIVKGFLIRRLMKTERVQRIIGSMRDTMTIALQLHREAKQVSMVHTGSNTSSEARPIKKVTMQDVELHRRLLQQLFKDSQEFHNIFFKVHLF